MRRSSPSIAVAVAVALCGCGSAAAPAPAPRPQPDPATAATTATSTSTAPSAPPERGAAGGGEESKGAPTSVSTSAPGVAVPALPATAILRGAFAIEPGARLPLAPGTEVVVDPAASFEVELTGRVPDARLVLLDAREDVLPASGGRELAVGTRLTLVPAAPLVPGSRYALRLDGAGARELHDSAGRVYQPISLPLLAAGTPLRPEPKPQPTRKKKRR